MSGEWCFFLIKHLFLFTLQNLGKKMKSFLRMIYNIYIYISTLAGSTTYYSY